jgi:hypothetical protein
MATGIQIVMKLDEAAKHQGICFWRAVVSLNDATTIDCYQLFNLTKSAYVSMSRDLDRRTDVGRRHHPSCVTGLAINGKLYFSSSLKVAPKFEDKFRHSVYQEDHMIVRVLENCLPDKEANKNPNLFDTLKGHPFCASCSEISALHLLFLDSTFEYGNPESFRGAEIVTVTSAGKRIADNANNISPKFPCTGRFSKDPGVRFGCKQVLESQGLVDKTEQIREVANNHATRMNGLMGAFSSAYPSIACPKLWPKGGHDDLSYIHHRTNLS